jgi:hypothetical protein
MNTRLRHIEQTASKLNERPVAFARLSVNFSQSLIANSEGTKVSKSFHNVYSKSSEQITFLKLEKEMLARRLQKSPSKEPSGSPEAVINTERVDIDIGNLPIPTGSPSRIQELVKDLDSASCNLAKLLGIQLSSESPRTSTPEPSSPVETNISSDEDSPIRNDNDDAAETAPLPSNENIHMTTSSTATSAGSSTPKASRSGSVTPKQLGANRLDQPLPPLPDQRQANEPQVRTLETMKLNPPPKTSSPIPEPSPPEDFGGESSITKNYRSESLENLVSLPTVSMDAEKDVWKDSILSLIKGL